MERPMRVGRILVLSIALPLVFAGDAQAYLDPGAGSFIFQTIVAMLLGLAFTLKMTWRRVKGYFSDKPPAVVESPREPEVEDGGVR